MKMRHEEVSQILLPPQLAHDLGDGQFGKNGSLVIPGVHNSMIFGTNKAYPYKSNWILWNKCVTFNIP
jgi:hypothetical protein